jgi:hypothetical protein
MKKEYEVPKNAHPSPILTEKSIGNDIAAKHENSRILEDAAAITVGADNMDTQKLHERNEEEVDECK